MPLQPRTQTGLERLADAPPPQLNGRRLGLLMNHASVDSALRAACDVVASCYPGQLSAIFSPQHGLWGEQQANMFESGHDWHPTWDVPIYSLYSETRAPTAEMLDMIDVLLIDLQDVGTRVYTFIWTVVNAMRACADRGIPVWILDRPNPLGGDTFEGPILSEGFESFVGLVPIPMRHGLTLGELAAYCKKHIPLDVDVHVVPLRGWTRGMHFADTGLRWIPTSPNLPTLTSVNLYPGQVLWEGTLVSEGRGTTVPFELVGAPGIDPFQLARRMEAQALPGVSFRPARFVPTFDKFQGQTCGGVWLHVTDRRRLRSFRTAIRLMMAIRHDWPESFIWRPPPYEYEYTLPPIDILYGDARLRRRVDEGIELEESELDELTRLDLEAWKESVRDVVLYDEG
jgi:uncharacterized protein YbbC (DUF1343 family)